MRSDGRPGQLPAQSAKDLVVYQRAYSQAMRIFRVSQRFPKEETYSLTSQVRRSSRSVCLNLREAWAKRRYEPHFLSKLSDSDAENSETETSLDFALDCGYLQPHEHDELVSECQEIGRMLGAMIRNPGPFLQRPHDR
jgi:four helix bundle protein